MPRGVIEAGRRGLSTEIARKLYVQACVCRRLGATPFAIRKTASELVIDFNLIAHRFSPVLYLRRCGRRSASATPNGADPAK